MGNSCCGRRKKVKTGSDPDSENWEERPDTVENRNGKKARKRKRLKKKKANKYKSGVKKTGYANPVPVPGTKNDAAKPDMKSPDSSTDINTKVIEVKTIVEHSEQTSVTSPHDDVSKKKESLAKKADGSFVNAVFIPDDGTEIEKSLKEVLKSVPNSPDKDSGFEASNRASSSSPENSGSAFVNDVIKTLDDVTNSKCAAIEDIFMEVSDMGTQLSPEAGCYATQVTEGPGIQDTTEDSQYPFVLKKRRKSSKISTKLSSKIKKAGRKASSNTMHCDDTVSEQNNNYPFDKGPHSGDLFPDDVMPKDLSQTKIKFVTKGLRVPVYYITDDVISSADGDTTKTTMTCQTEDDEDEGIDATEFSDVRMKIVRRCLLKRIGVAVFTLNYGSPPGDEKIHARTSMIFDFYDQALHNDYI